MFKVTLHKSISTGTITDVYYASLEKQINLPFMPVKGMGIREDDGTLHEIEFVCYHMLNKDFVCNVNSIVTRSDMKKDRQDKKVKVIVAEHVASGWEIISSKPLDLLK